MKPIGLASYFKANSAVSLLQSIGTLCTFGFWDEVKSLKNGQTYLESVPLQKFTGNDGVKNDLVNRVFSVFGCCQARKRCNICHDSPMTHVQVGIMFKRMLQNVNITCWWNQCLCLISTKVQTVSRKRRYHLVCCWTSVMISVFLCPLALCLQCRASDMLFLH